VLIGNSYFNCTTGMDIATPSAGVGPTYADDLIDTGASIFADTSQSTAAACDFTIVRAAGASIGTFGFVDGSNNKTFQSYVDPGLGINATGGGVARKPGAQLR